MHSGSEAGARPFSRTCGQGHPAAPSLLPVVSWLGAASLELRHQRHQCLPEGLCVSFILVPLPRPLQEPCIQTGPHSRVLGQGEPHGAVTPDTPTAWSSRQGEPHPLIGVTATRQGCTPHCTHLPPHATHTRWPSQMESQDCTLPRTWEADTHRGPWTMPSWPEGTACRRPCWDIWAVPTAALPQKLSQHIFPLAGTGSFPCVGPCAHSVSACPVLPGWHPGGGSSFAIPISCVEHTIPP